VSRSQRSLSTPLTYEQWERFVFERSITASGSSDDPDLPEGTRWDERVDTRRALEYLTRLFRNPADLPRRYSRAQIDQGLHYLISPSSSGHAHVLSDVRLPWSDRTACFEAMIALYEKLMAPVYKDDLGHTNHGSGFHSACYMWWDIFPLWGGMDHPDRDRINEAVLNVCEYALGLRALSCQESALHGLGHWHLEIPEQTGPIVERFLARTDINRAIRAYAELAAAGHVQ
jgi:hypothetical protein